MAQMISPPELKQALSFRKLLENKLKAFHGFMSATSMLMDHLDRENLKNIEGMIEAREVWITRINRIDSEIIACEKGNSAIFVPESSLESLVRSISEIARRAARVNDRCLRTLRDRLDTLRNELSRSAHQGRRSGTYPARSGQAARFFDIKS